MQHARAHAAQNNVGKTVTFVTNVTVTTTKRVVARFSSDVCEKFRHSFVTDSSLTSLKTSLTSTRPARAEISFRKKGMEVGANTTPAVAAVDDFQSK